MSKYTTEVRYICETYAGLDESEGYLSVDEIISKSINKIFDFDYPLFDPDYRGVLETKIIRHYYTKEIGLETVGLWKLKLQTKLNEIMPYYNKLYESELIKFDPMTDFSYTREGNSEKNDTGNVRTEGSENRHGVLDVHAEEGVDRTNWDKYADTPQGGITGLESDTYLTNARKITDERDTENDRNETTDNNVTMNNTKTNALKSTDDYIEKIYGKHGEKTYSKMLMDFRDSFLNIDVDIINELKDLFMNIW